MRSVSGIKKGVILLSGGIDSAVTLYFARNKGYRLKALIFDYNQRHKKEIEYARKIARLNKIDYRFIKCDLSWTGSSLTNRKVKVPLSRNLCGADIPPTYVSGRNIIFLSYAASLAESIKAQAIFIGAHIEDYSGYPDCRPNFLNSFQRALNLGLKNKGLRIVAPLLNKHKREIVRMGVKLGVPFKYTWSCYSGGKFPCLRCDSCRFRSKAFMSLGLDDPLKTRRSAMVLTSRQRYGAGKLGSGSVGRKNIRGF